MQWVKPSQPKEQKPKTSKVAACPVLPPRDSPTDFPSLGKSDTKSKKSTTVTMPVSGVWVNNDQGTSKETKSKNKKKKSKNTNNSENEKQETLKTKEDVSKIDKDVNKNDTKLLNGVIKKRTELKIDSLQIADTNLANGNDFPALGSNKLPPGISMQPPPGFAANNLTFTSSSGQSYSILPTHHFISPPNFMQRNKALIDKFMSCLKSNEDILEFRQLSNMFRNGDFASNEYYEHCKQVIGADNFSVIFPELLVLLPDIQKQQELYNHHVSQGGSKRSLEVCATCNQVVASSDLRTHLSNHTLENHFPALGAQEISSVWRK